MNVVIVQNPQGVMNRLCCFLRALPLVLAMLAAPALAQGLQPLPSVNAPASAPAPAQAPVPTQAQAQTTNNQNPPQIRICSATDGRGIWKLVRVFETPKGPRTLDFTSLPHQYIWLKGDGTFFAFKRNTPVKVRANLIRMMQSSATKQLRQFVLGEKGILYYYTDQKFTESFHCGISTENAGIYRKGDMILTPTSKQVGSLFEVYRHPQFSRQPPARNTP